MKSDTLADDVAADAKPKQRARSTMRRRDRDDNEEGVKGSSRREKSVGAQKKTEDRTGWSTQYTPYAPRRTYKSKYQEFLAAEWRY